MGHPGTLIQKTVCLECLQQSFCANVLEQGLSHMKEAAVKAASVEQGMESISESLFTVTHY